MAISAQFSLYPLRQERLSPAIEEAVSVLKEHGLTVETGIMSSLVLGDEDQVFGALQEAFRRSAEKAEVVWVLTLSNACPMPGV